MQGDDAWFVGLGLKTGAVNDFISHYARFPIAHHIDESIGYVKAAIRYIPM